MVNKVQIILDKHKKSLEKQKNKLCDKLFKNGVSCCVFCTCGIVLNQDVNVIVEDIGEDSYKYTCTCGEISYFNFAIALVPLKMIKTENGFKVKN